MPSPRIAPATLEQMGEVNAGIARSFARRLGVSGLPNVFSTLARSRRLFGPYMEFAIALIPDGAVPRDSVELLILRSALNTGSAYEWDHHRRIGLRVGLSEEDIERVRRGWRDDGWSPDRAAILRAADELHHDFELSDETWSELRSWFEPDQILEMCLLVGNYTMLAMFLNTARVQLEDEPAR